MLPDAFHYRRALAPQGLRTLDTVATAIQQAIANAATMELKADQCPAVMLLLRHQSRIDNKLDIDIDYHADAKLRQACSTMIEHIERKPLLPHLIQCRNPSSPDRNHFIRRTKRKLSDLATALGNCGRDIRIEITNLADEPLFAVTTNALALRVIRTPLPGTEIMYTSRTRSHRHKPRYAPIAALDTPETLAANIIETLELTHVV